jgi:hypothetical protein
MGASGADEGGDDVSRRKIGGGKKYDKGAYRATGRGQHVSSGMTSFRRGGEVSLSITGFDAGTIPRDPSRVIGKQIRDALDPTKAPSKPKTFAEMTEAERQEMRKLYEKKP